MRPRPRVSRSLSSEESTKMLVSTMLFAIHLIWATCCRHSARDATGDDRYKSSTARPDTREGVGEDWPDWSTLLGARLLQLLGVAFPIESLLGVALPIEFQFGVAFPIELLREPMLEARGVCMRDTAGVCDCMAFGVARPDSFRGLCSGVSISMTFWSHTI